MESNSSSLNVKLDERKEVSNKEKINVFLFSNGQTYYVLAWPLLVTKYQLFIFILNSFVQNSKICEIKIKFEKVNVSNSNKVPKNSLQYAPETNLTFVLLTP
jgi:hypothetical protein